MWTVRVELTRRKGGCCCGHRVHRGGNHPPPGLPPSGPYTILATAPHLVLTRAITTRLMRLAWCTESGTDQQTRPPPGCPSPERQCGALCPGGPSSARRTAWGPGASCWADGLTICLGKHNQIAWSSTFSVKLFLLFSICNLNKIIHKHI